MTSSLGNLPAPPVRRFRITLSAIAYLDVEVQAEFEHRARSKALEIAGETERVAMGEWNIDFMEEIE